ncbi:DUF6941 family protein [Caldicellulosiruptor naganoensis]|uniref:Uncharacterized protein n=1 Tax=Caldicellulosiruptor naganoensis TaxID=29324 RepID=A0ABY7BFZ0_9FIRM|nr:hypothetical protein [Caldicellulosiruptor naganoensis]WAM31016.1 hypothetical protein OTJ99_001820 [Caldicellulosiruptor naganoensis]
MAKVGWGHFCDYAFFDQGGKVCLIGIFKYILAQHVPVQHTRCAFVFQVLGEPNENVKIELRLMRPDSREPLLNLQHPGFVLSPEGEAIHVIGLDNLLLPDYGPYEMEVFLNNTYEAGFIFEVRRTCQ